MSITFVIMILSMIVVSYAPDNTNPEGLPIAVDLDENFLLSVQMKFGELLERLKNDFEKNNGMHESYKEYDHRMFRCFIEMSTLFFQSTENVDTFLKKANWRVIQFTVEVDTYYSNSKGFNESYVKCTSSLSKYQNYDAVHLLSCIATAIETFITNLKESSTAVGIAPDNPEREVGNENFLIFVKTMFEKLFHLLDTEFNNVNKTLIVYENCPLSHPEKGKTKETEDHQLLRCFIETSTMFLNRKKYDDTFLNEVHWKISEFTMGVGEDYNNDKNFNKSYEQCISAPREVQEKGISLPQKKESEAPTVPHVKEIESGLSISTVQEEKEKSISPLQKEKENGISSLQEEKKSEAPTVSHVKEIESEAHQLFRCIAAAIDTFFTNLND